MAEVKDGTLPVEPTNEVQQTQEPESQEPEKPLTAAEVRKLMADGLTAAREEGYKQSQRVIARREAEIKVLKERKPQPATGVSPDLLTKMLSAVETGDQNAITAARIAIANAEAKVKEVEQLNYQTIIIEENRSKFADIIEKAGIDPEDPRLVTFDVAFETALTTGRFDKVESVLNKVLKGIAPTAPVPAPVAKPVVTEDAEFERRFQERKRREELGVPDTGAVAKGSSGIGKRIYTQEEIRDPAIWAANKDDIRKAQGEGRIKD
jgi:hypothetical protein